MTIPAQFTDKVLATVAARFPGPNQHRAEHLLKVPAQDRPEICAEAEAVQALNHGMEIADAVGSVVTEYLSTGIIPSRSREQAERDRLERQARAEAEYAARYTDATLTAQADDGRFPGTQRRAEHLLMVPFEVRADIVAEAHTMMNMSPGWRPSDTVAHIVAEYVRTGRVPTGYRDEADRSRRADNARRDAELAAAAAAFHALNKG